MLIIFRALFKVCHARQPIHPLHNPVLTETGQQVRDSAWREWVVGEARPVLGQTQGLKACWLGVLLKGALAEEEVAWRRESMAQGD